jgi:lipid-binding SYLF domain-containing protein
MKTKEERMMKRFRLATVVVVFAFSVAALIAPKSSGAASRTEIDRNVKSALQNLYAKTPASKALGEKAQGILVFPSITKGGFMVGGQFGEGALIQAGKTAGYYNTLQVSYGLQAGLQKYGYALFFMTGTAMKWIDRSDGWEVGTGPTIVVVDAGTAKSMTTTTLQSDVYAFFFDQKGLMGGLGLQGTKISKVKK